MVRGCSLIFIFHLSSSSKTRMLLLLLLLLLPFFAP